MGYTKTGYIGNTRFGSSSSLWELLEGGSPWARQLSADSTGCSVVLSSSIDPSSFFVDTPQERFVEDEGPNPIVDRFEADQLSY